MGNKWSEYRTRFRMFLLAWLGGIIFAFFGILIALRLTGELWTVYLIFSLWVIGFVHTGFRLNAFLCPRCGKRYFGNWFYCNHLRKTCDHCGLPKWQEE